MEKIIELKTPEPTVLFGVGDSNIKVIEDSLDAKILVRGDKVKISGDRRNVEKVNVILYEMIDTLNANGNLTIKDVQNLVAIVKSEDLEDNFRANKIKDRLIYFGKNGAVVPKTRGQINYYDVVKNNDVVFSIGPAGTGKTFLSVAFAVSALEKNELDRIILCRPAVEAGENLGFLPGDLKEKVDPYLAPLYDALLLLYPEQKLSALLDTKIIEVVPLAYMRGRTLDNSYMILDEAQNATALQMKMFLTRMGIGSRAIITGDVTQIDLQNQFDSGLIQARDLLKNVNGIGFARLDKNDIVRHSLVMKIIEAYEKNSVTKRNS